MKNELKILIYKCLEASDLYFICKMLWQVQDGEYEKERRLETNDTECKAAKRNKIAIVLSSAKQMIVCGSNNQTLSD